MFVMHTQERDTEIDRLKRQLEEFVVKTTAYAAAGAAEAGSVAVAERPAGADWDIPSAWRTAESTKPRCLSLRSSTGLRIAHDPGFGFLSEEALCPSCGTTHVTANNETYEDLH